jgi:uncharacterized protein (TIGR00369 family)
MDLARLMKESPYHRWLGVELTREEQGQVEVRLPYREEFAGDDAGTSIHGGIVASLADIATCFAAISSVREDVPTIDLRMDYLRRALPGEDLIATGRTVKAGKAIIFADVEVRSASGKVAAVGRATFIKPSGVAG